MDYYSVQLNANDYRDATELLSKRRGPKRTMQVLQTEMSRRRDAKAVPNDRLATRA